MLQKIYWRILQRFFRNPWYLRIYYIEFGIHTCAQKTSKISWLKPDNNVRLRAFLPLKKSQKTYCFKLSGFPMKPLKPILETKTFVHEKIQHIIEE